jgi:hypothetical protein
LAHIHLAIIATEVVVSSADDSDHF